MGSTKGFPWAAAIRTDAPIESWPLVVNAISIIVPDSCIAVATPPKRVMCVRGETRRVVHEGPGLVLQVQSLA